MATQWKHHKRKAGKAHLALLSKLIQLISSVLAGTIAGLSMFSYGQALLIRRNAITAPSCCERRLPSRVGATVRNLAAYGFAALCCVLRTL